MRNPGSIASRACSGIALSLRTLRWAWRRDRNGLTPLKSAGGDALLMFRAIVVLLIASERLSERIGDISRNLFNAGCIEPLLLRDAHQPLPSGGGRFTQALARLAYGFR